MLPSFKVAKKHVHVYCFHGKHFTCRDLRGMLETDNFVQKDNEQTLMSVQYTGGMQYTGGYSVN